MCFRHDYDWTADVVEQGVRAVTKPVRCDECHRAIEPGQTVHETYLQQYEECSTCGGEDCECDPPDYGETFDYGRCDDCHRFLDAVEAAEVAAGCSRSEARPGLEVMMEAIGDGGQEEARKYFKEAVRRHPELRVNGYLGWLWRRMFSNG